MNTKTVEELQAEIEALKRERDGWEAAACDYSELKQMLNDTKRQLAESQANLKLSDNRREELASRKHQLELDLAEAQAKITHDVDEEWMNEVDEEWLDEIAKRWNELTGKPWDPLAGETREEGLQANVGALFNYIEESRAALAKSEAAGAEMRGMLKMCENLYRAESNYPEAGMKHALSIVSCGTGFVRVEQLEPIIELLLRMPKHLRFIEEALAQLEALKKGVE